MSSMKVDYSWADIDVWFTDHDLLYYDLRLIDLDDLETIYPLKSITNPLLVNQDIDGLLLEVFPYRC